MGPVGKVEFARPVEDQVAANMVLRLRISVLCLPSKGSRVRSSSLAPTELELKSPCRNAGTFREVTPKLHLSIEINALQICGINSKEFTTTLLKSAEI